MTITPDQAKRLTIAAVVVSGGLASVDAIRQGRRPELRIGLGMVVAGVGLSLVSEVSPQLGGSLAALLLVSSVFIVGAPALATISGGLNR